MVLHVCSLLSEISIRMLYTVASYPTASSRRDPRPNCTAELSHICGRCDAICSYAPGYASYTTVQLYCLCHARRRARARITRNYDHTAYALSQFTFDGTRARQLKGFYLFGMFKIFKQYYSY